MIFDSNNQFSHSLYRYSALGTVYFLAAFTAKKRW